jgi:hypothetical protein
LGHFDAGGWSNDARGISEGRTIKTHTENRRRRRREQQKGLQWMISCLRSETDGTEPKLFSCGRKVVFWHGRAIIRLPEFVDDGIGIGALL